VTQTPSRSSEQRKYRITFGPRDTPRLVLEVYAASQQVAGQQHDELREDCFERMEVKPLREVAHG
jgi:hypothetical protein